MKKVLINSRTAIAGAIIAILLVFYDSKGIGFLRFFLTGSTIP